MGHGMRLIFEFLCFSCWQKYKKIPRPEPAPELRKLGALQSLGSMSKKFVNLQRRYLLVLFNGLRRSRMERRVNVKKESPLFI